MDVDNKSKADPFSETNLPDGSGPAKVSKKNLQNERLPERKLSWLIGCIPIIIIVVLIFLLRSPKEEGIKMFDGQCMQIHPMSQTYNCLATIEKPYESGPVRKQVGIYMKECIERNLPNSVQRFKYVSELKQIHSLSHADLCMSSTDV